MKNSNNLYLAIMFICGILIGVLTMVSDQSPGPIGLLYSAVFIFGPLIAVLLIHYQSFKCWIKKNAIRFSRSANQ